MDIVGGLYLFYFILQTTTAQVLLPTPLGSLHRPLYLTNIRCRKCKQLMPTPYAPIPALPEPALPVIPEVLRDFRGVPSLDKTNVDPQIEITQEEELTFRSKSELDKFLSDRRSVPLLESVLKNHNNRQNEGPKASKLVEGQLAMEHSTLEDKVSDEKALKCAQIECGLEELKGPLCACNFKTGNTVSFKNECDMNKHNCRFNTGFKAILDDICPWQFVSRSGAGEAENMRINYDDSRYYN